MRTETRARIAEPDDAIRAAFDLFEAVLASPEQFEDYNGSMLRPAERIEISDSEGRHVERGVSFDVFKPQPGRAEVLPEMGRVLIEA